MIYYLKNLSSQQTFPGDVLPWDFEAPIPENVRKDKKARTAWATNPSTSHYFYSLAEGVNPNARLTAKEDENSNPIQKLYGLAVDYDAPMTDAEVAAGLTRLTHKVNFIERTLSGNIRLIFIFEKPLNIPGNKAGHEFLRVASDKLKLKMFGPGFDEPAFVEPSRYYANSCQWMIVDEAVRLDNLLVRGWFIEAGKKIVWDRAEFGATIPLDKVAEKLAEKYPKFADWGEFELRSQGPTFWLDASVSPKSAIVHETGIYTFSANAPKPFYSWADLLGAQFVDEFCVRRSAEATEGVFYDGKNYWVRSPKNRFDNWPKEALITHLRVSRKVSTSRDKTTQTSDLDRVVDHIHTFNRVDAAGPYIYFPSGIISVEGGKTALNTCNTRPLAPVPGGATVDQFPFIWKFLQGFLSSEIQLTYLLSWASHFYRGALKQKPTQGQAVVLAGPPGIGKTFFTRAIMGRLMGGVSDGGDFLTGRDTFNGDAFECGILAVDDNAFLQSAKDRRVFNEKVKAATANGSFRCNNKYEKACLVKWPGRIIITANIDEESAAQIPAADISNEEKLSLFRTADKLPVEFPDYWEIEAILERDMPFFAAWLRDFQIPSECRSPEARFGVKAYHEPSLLETAHQSTETYSFFEILHDWMIDWFRDHPGVDCWEGTAHQLQKSILTDPALIIAMKNYSAIAIGRALAGLKKSSRYNIEAFRKEGMRYWKICPAPELLAGLRGVKTVVPGTKQDSAFTKS